MLEYFDGSIEISLFSQATPQYPGIQKKIVKRSLHELFSVTSFYDKFPCSGVAKVCGALSEVEGLEPHIHGGP